MNRFYLFTLLLLQHLLVFSQKEEKNEKLDDFFAGIPLQAEFEKCFEYVRTHPYLGIDSTGKRGFYSSFKPGIKNYFPFPDSTKVKFLLKKIVFVDSLTKERHDSSTSIMIEGVFPDNKKGKKEAREVFREIRKKLKSYYRQETRTDDYSGSWFKKGKTVQFPNASIWYGYEENKRFYYVLIGYDFPARDKNPWYLKEALEE